MIRLKAILYERFYDIIKQYGKDKYDWVDISQNPIEKDAKKDIPLRQNLFDLVNDTYKRHLNEPHRGITSANDVLGTKYDYWEAIDVDEDPNAEAVLFGQRRNGIKISGLGHNGESQVKHVVLEQIADLCNDTSKNYWIECSQSVPKALLKYGAKQVKDREIIEKLFGDTIVEFFDDYSYIRRRKTSGKLTDREYMFGNPKI